MIGIYGIIGKPEDLTGIVIDECFSRMTSGVKVDAIHGHGYMLGIAKRSGHENKDLSLKLFENGLAIAISGYARFPKEEQLRWAVDLVEPVVKAFLEHDVAALTTLQGCFCLCLIHNCRFLILGDRFGSKNLFYADLASTFVFAPDVRAVLSSSLVPFKRDLEGVKQVLVSGFFLGDRTLVRDIRRFPYGTVLEKRFLPWQQTHQQKYWKPPATEGRENTVISDLAATLYEKGRNAILRLNALENRIAVPLSGGLDSRYIASVLASVRRITALTYDMSDETTVAAKVAHVLGAKHFVFDNTLIEDPSFRQSLNGLISEQRRHTVANQYFYSPLFRNYLENSPDTGIYDGVYLDILFSAPYTYRSFDPNHCAVIYGGGAQGILLSYSRLLVHSWKQVVLDAYDEWCEGLHGCDGVERSQLMYLVGRLRRYVNECAADREQYGYLFRPGFDHELCDFGYGLNLELRKGVVYSNMLRMQFPEVMKIPYKDSYGNRPKTLIEKTQARLYQGRIKLSYASHGLIPFYPYQADLFFYKLGAITDQEYLFTGPSYIDEIVSHDQMKNLYEKCKEKQYMLNLFQRIQFIQGFYRVCGF